MPGLKPKHPIAGVPAPPVDKRPKCVHCNRTLRPNYRTVKENLNESTGKTKLWSDEYSAIAPQADPPDPTKPLGCLNRDGQWYWSPKRRLWWKWGSRPLVISRDWLGTYGAEGDNYFCNKSCGYRWAVQRCKVIYGGSKQ